jgi:hypothetical protein
MRVSGARQLVSAVLAVTGVAVLLLTTTAAAATYRVSGTQTTVNEAKGTSRMHGGLIGSWRTTSFKQISTDPIYRAQGTERFRGCLNVDRDRSCEGDPSGTLSFRFIYWAQFASDGSLVWGSCLHPVTGGGGDFDGASGVISMVDTPTKSGVRTDYTGNITIGSHPRAASASTVAAPHCG